MNTELSNIHKDWENTNQILKQISKEVCEACMPKEKDEVKLKELRERSVDVHNKRIAINIAINKLNKQKKISFEIFKMARQMGTEEDLNFINSLIGNFELTRTKGLDIKLKFI